MISHLFPHGAAFAPSHDAIDAQSREAVPAYGEMTSLRAGCDERQGGPAMAGGGKADGPLRGELHAAARCQGTGLGPGAVPAGARARRFRRPLLLPDLG